MKVIKIQSIVTGIIMFVLVLSSGADALALQVQEADGRTNVGLVIYEPISIDPPPTDPPPIDPPPVDPPTVDPPPTVQSPQRPSDDNNSSDSWSPLLDSAQIPAAQTTSHELEKMINEPNEGYGELNERSEESIIWDEEARYEGISEPEYENEGENGTEEITEQAFDENSIDSDSSRESNEVISVDHVEENNGAERAPGYERANLAILEGDDGSSYDVNFDDAFDDGADKELSASFIPGRRYEGWQSGSLLSTLPIGATFLGIPIPLVGERWSGGSLDGVENGVQSGILSPLNDSAYHAIFSLVLLIAGLLFALIKAIKMIKRRQCASRG